MAGALSAPATDIAKFMLAHLNQGRLGEAEILQPQTAELMHDTPLTILPRVDRMLLGFWEANYKGRRVIAHGGDTQWFHSDLRLYIDDGVGMFVACNSMGKGMAAIDMRIELFEEFADRYLSVPGWTDYASINLGAFFAPLICGTLGEVYGWHYGFGAAGIGMLLGLIIYVSGAKYLPPDSPRTVAEDRSTHSGDVKRQLILLVSIASVVVVFRGAYEQIGNTFASWADIGVDRRIADGLTIPMTWFQSLNPMFVFLLTPVLVIWTRAARRGRDPSSLVKMALRSALVALAYLMLALLLSVHVGVVSWVWAVLFVFLLTAGELFILPTGLALFGQLAPRRLAATVMALWFLGSFGGNLLAGVLGSLWSAMSMAGFFTAMAATAGLAAVLLLALRPNASHRTSASIQA